MRASPRVLLLPAFVLLAIFVATGASGQNAIPHDVTGNGGGQSTAGPIFLRDTIGQAVIGVSTGAPTTHRIGYWYAVDALHIGPTSAVAITSFVARFRDGGVDVEWSIAASNGPVGFNMYRSETENGVFVKLNDALLPAENGTTYRDPRVRPGAVYRYQLGAIDLDGEFFSPEVSVVIPSGKPELYQNYPNPFNPSTTVSFYLPRTERVVLTIYDVSGRVVRRLLNEPVSYGRTDVDWDGRNDNGARVGSGVYFYRLQAGKHLSTRKLTVLK